MLTWTRLDSPLGPLLATASPQGLRSLGVWTEPPDAPEAPMPLLTRWMDDYWARRPRPVDLLLDAQVTVFQARVHQELLGVPFGQTLSYADLARRVGSNPRAVGQANGANPIAIVVPCHRIVGSGGALVGYAGGLPMKLALLRHEGALLL